MLSSPLSFPCTSEVSVSVQRYWWIPLLRGHALTRLEPSGAVLLTRRIDDLVILARRALPIAMGGTSTPDSSLLLYCDVVTDSHCCSVPLGCV